MTGSGLARWWLGAGGVIVALATLVVAPVGADPRTATSGAPDRRTGELPLGPPGLHERRTTLQLVPGVGYTVIRRGRRSADEHFTVDVTLTRTRHAAEAEVQRLTDAGFRPRLRRIAQGAPDDPDGPRPYGWLVRVGVFDAERAADALAAKLVSAGFSDARVADTAQDGSSTTGPWVVRVLKVDLARFEGRVLPHLATGIIPGKQLLTTIAARTGALAAVNGGFYVVGPEDGTPGDLAGVSVLHGSLNSEALDGRTSLVLEGRRARVAAVSTDETVTAGDGARRVLDGRNRKPGLIRSCGGDGGDVPTEEPKHDFTCVDLDELILFTPVFGDTTEPGEGVEAVLDAAGRVTRLREGRGGAIPPDGAVLAGTEGAASWLRAHTRVGTRLRVRTSVWADDQPLRLRERLHMVNGGPRLVRGGRVDITAFAEGFVWPEDPRFYYGFGIVRHPRTLAGVTRDGHLLLIVADGRQPTYSVGLSFRESARVLRALGAVEGVNLDGGGSSTLTIGNRLANRPADDTGERPIADALLLQAPGQ